MRKGFAIALLFSMMISHAWAENFEAAPPPENWNKVQSMPPNTNITLELKYGGEVSGEFIRLTEDSILINEYAREKIYPKNEVARVKWLRPGSRARNAAVIGGIVFGIGFGLGYAGATHAADRNDMPAGERAVVGVGVGGLLGGATAAFSLLHRPGLRGETIYRAR